MRPIGPKPAISTSSPSTRGWRRRRSEATSKWKSFLSRFRSYSVTRYRPTFLVLTFGRRSDGQPADATSEDYRSILDVVSPPGAQVVECRAETFARRLHSDYAATDERRKSSPEERRDRLKRRAGRIVWRRR